MFARSDDEVYIVTGRNEKLRDITIEWLERYYPTLCDNLYTTGKDGDNLYNCINQDEIIKWVERRLKGKADIINTLNIDVFFDDSKEVPKLRKLCPNTKIIQVGGQI